MPRLSLEELVVRLYDVEGLKFGKFTMRTGEASPVYIDMRVMWSYPDIVKAVCEHMWKKIVETWNPSQYQFLCGLPFQGVPLASYLSIEHSVPMLLKRPHVKQYGTRNLLEGHFENGDQVVLLDDVIMTGGSLVKDIPGVCNRGSTGESIYKLFDADLIARDTPWKNCTGYCSDNIFVMMAIEEEGLKVLGSAVFFDREQGGTERVRHLRGTETHCVLTLSKAFDCLLKAHRISQDTVTKTMEYLQSNRFDTPEYGVEEEASASF